MSRLQKYLGYMENTSVRCMPFAEATKLNLSPNLLIGDNFNIWCGMCDDCLFNPYNKPTIRGLGEALDE
ncbi:hypothetical protein [Vibrio phage vB_VhaP_PG11]|nr:hypothetical protein [Vibrio phage vB_VhaP_PG11]